MKTVYLDNNATTMVAREVVEEMLPYLGEYYGNPSSMHTFGGQVAGQSLVSATRTVDPAYRVHSLHGYFLRPGKSD